VNILFHLSYVWLLLLLYYQRHFDLQCVGTRFVPLFTILFEIQFLQKRFNFSINIYRTKLPVCQAGNLFDPMFLLYIVRHPIVNNCEEF
jgi:hypothetical protein